MAPKSFVATLDIFKTLPASELATLERRMVARKYKKGETIFLEGDPAENVWFVKTGHVKAVVHSADGKDMTLCMMGANNLFGTCCCFGEKEHPCHTQAETDAEVVSLPLAEFMGLLDRYPGMSKTLVMHLSERLRQSKDMRTFDQESVEKRILHILLRLTTEFGNTIPLTKREVAEMVGTTVESSIRTFTRLEEQGLVATSRGKITVRSTNELTQRLAAEV